MPTPHHLRTWLEINTGALKNNYQLFRRQIPKTCQLMAVVKSNAYGHGLMDFSLACQKLGVDWFGVDSIVEADSLRKAKIKKPILVLGYTLAERIEDANKNNISITVSNFDTLQSLKKYRHLKPALKVHLKIDTGMHRQGFFLQEIPTVIKFFQQHQPAMIEGIYTHFAIAKDPATPKYTMEQLAKLQRAVKILEKAGYHPLRHAAATGGALLYPQSHLDLVRIGIGLYGLWPSKECQQASAPSIPLKPILIWKTIVAEIKNLPKGSGIGYDLTEKVKRDSKIAILPIGYWHGYPRALSSIGFVIIKDKQCKVLGRISMDMTIVDVTKIPNLKVGEEVILIGQQGKTAVTADELARLTHTINYEIITRLNPRMMRVYL